MRAASAGERAIVYGAGVRGGGAIREMLSNSRAGLVPVGFLDDNPLRVGKTLDGYPILGSLAEIGKVLAETKANVVVVASDQIPAHKVAEAKRACSARGVRLVRMRVGFETVPIDPLPAEADSTEAR